MSLRVDTARAHRTLAELADLVAAIVASDGKLGQESHWLEWKGPLPIDKQEGHFHIARAILGFANRDPERAARVCEGIAYVVVGAAPASVPGVKAVDFADLSQGVDRYVQGVRWTPQYVAHDDKTVLVVIVEAPRAGDPIHTLRKGTDKFDAGTIYHRGAGRTAPANPDDVKMLSDRIVAGLRPTGLTLELRAEARDPLMRLNGSEEAQQDWLDRREAHLRVTVEKPEPEPRQTAKASPDDPFGFRGMNAGILDGLFSGPAEQSAYDRAMEEYLDLCRKRLLRNVVRDIVRDAGNAATLAVVNESDEPISDLVVTARIERAPGILVFTSAPDARPMPESPEWPTRRDALASITGMHTSVPLMPIPALAGAGGSPLVDPRMFDTTVVDEHDDYFEVSWSVGDLLAESDDETTFYLAFGPAAPEQVPVELYARSKSHRGVARGTSTLFVDAASSWQLADWFDPTVD